MAKNVRINVRTEGGYDILHPETEAGQVVMAGYAKSELGGSVAETDTVNVAVGKLEKGVEDSIPKTDIAQVRGRSETKVMSQKAVTDAIDAGGGSGGGAGDAEPIGVIKPYAGETLPDGYLWCDGTSYPANGDYLKLYGIIGTAYNQTGDAAGTFRVPDLRGRVPVGKNEGTFDAIGKTGGAEAHKLTGTELPRTNIVSSTGFKASPDAGSEAGSLHLPYSGSANGGGTSSWVVNGGGEAHNNLQPYAVCNYIIKYARSYGEIGVTAPPCIWEIKQADWQVHAPGGYVLNIPESEHKRGEHSVLTALYDTSEADKLRSVIPETEKDAAGNITIYSDTAFPAKAYIDRVYMVPAGRVLTVNGQGPDVDGDVTIAEERIENENGKAIKYPGGTLICTKSFLYKSDSTGQEGSMHYGKRQSMGNWAVPFAETPVVSAIPINGTSCFLDTMKDVTNSSAGTINVYKNSNFTNLAMFVQVIAVGKWK